MPRLTVQENEAEVPLDLLEVGLEVTMLGDRAEVVWDVLFRHQHPGQREGEFSLRLPEGATVSTFAMDVPWMKEPWETGTTMREATAVGRAQARNAYESIKARRIDPGLVEREAGNTYRTRIFPLPRDGTKRVRIGYVMATDVRDGRHRVELPLDHGDWGVKTYRISVRSAGGEEVVAMMPDGQAPRGTGAVEILREDAILKGQLLSLIHI